MERETVSITAFPKYNLYDVPEALRQLANRIEHGEISAVRVVVCIEPENGSPTYSAFGSEPFTNGHAAGLSFFIAGEILR